MRFKGRSKQDMAGHTGIDDMYHVRTSTRKDILEQTPTEVKKTHFIPTVQRNWAPGEIKTLGPSIEYGRRPKSVPIPLPDSRPKSRQEFYEDARMRYGDKYKPFIPGKPPPPEPPKKSVAQQIRDRDTHNVDTTKLLKAENREFSFIVPESGPFEMANRKKTKKQLRQEEARKRKEAREAAEAAAEEERIRLHEEEEARKAKVLQDAKDGVLDYLRPWDASRRPKTVEGKIEMYKALTEVSDMAKGWRPADPTLKMHTVLEVAGEALGPEADILDEKIKNMPYSNYEALKAKLEGDLPRITLENRDFEAEANMLKLFPHLAAYLPKVEDKPVTPEPSPEPTPELSSGKGRKSPMNRRSSVKTPGGSPQKTVKRRGSTRSSVTGTPTRSSVTSRSEEGSEPPLTPKVTRGYTSQLRVVEADLYNQRTFVTQDAQVCERWEDRLRKSLGRLEGIKGELRNTSLDVQVESSKHPPRSVATVWHGYTPLQDIAWTEAKLAQTKSRLYEFARPRVSVAEGGLAQDIYISERKEDGH